jgi:hypothetical protein
MKETTAMPKALQDICCVISAYIQPPVYFSVSKPVSNEAHITQKLLVCGIDLVSVFWYLSMLYWQ